MGPGSNISKQVVRLHQEQGLDAEQISEGLGLGIAEVTAMLAIIPKGKQTNGIKSTIEKHADEAVMVLSELMGDEDQPGGVRLGAAKFIAETALGKHDAPGTTEAGTKIDQLNVIFQQGNDAYKQIAGDVEDEEPIDITPREGKET